MLLLRFSGTPSAIGEAFGETCRDAITELYQRRLTNAIGQARDYGGRNVGEDAVLAVAAACLEPTRAHDPRGYEELEGIARGSNLPLVKVLAMNGLTDIRDVLAWGGELESLGGCSAFMVQGDWTSRGKLLAGQTWDLATDNMPYVVGVERTPSNGPRTWTLTTVGCLSLIGINEHGIGVGTTNIRTTDSRPGVTYLSLIHKALGSRTLPNAISAIRDAQRAGAHFYWVVAAAGVEGSEGLSRPIRAEGRERAFAIECTPRSADTFELIEGYYVHTNHCLIPAHVTIEGNTPSASSHARQVRLEERIAADRGQASLDAAKNWLADRAGGENAISRTDFGGISSNGAVVLEPSTGTIHVCHGPPHERAAGEWIDLRA